MSFDVFLCKFENGSGAIAPREPVLQALRRYPYDGPSDYGIYTVELPDGTGVEFNARGLESDEEFTGCAFHIRQFGDDLFRFIFRVARGGGFVMFPAMEGNPVILVSDVQRSQLPDDLFEDFPPVLVQSPEELREVLTAGIEAWASYRDSVLRRYESDGGA